MKNKIIKIYCLIGKAFCASAGSILGYVIGGPIVAALGLLGGYIIGHLLSKSVLKTCFKKSL